MNINNKSFLLDSLLYNSPSSLSWSSNTEEPVLCGGDAGF